jgi:hypothetical protein
MKYIKTFEGLKSSDSKFFIHPDSDKYAGKFFIVMPPHLNMSYEKQKKGHLVYCKEILIPKINYGEPNYDKIWPYGENFDIYEDNTIKLTGGYGWHYNEKDFAKIHFMSAEELLEEHEEICIALYLSVLEDSKKKWADWYQKAIEKVKSKLETVSGFEYFVSANKYNL